LCCRSGQSGGKEAKYRLHAYGRESDRARHLSPKSNESFPLPVLAASMVPCIAARYLDAERQPETRARPRGEGKPGIAGFAAQLPCLPRRTTRT